MAASQFTIYTSSDPGGPGLIFGATGSLISVLDACLVNGYAGKPAAGWTKPLPNLSGSLGCWKQASGSMMTLFVNDGNPNQTASPREAWACGFEQITSLTGSTGAGSIFTGSYGNGFGQGQFPTAAQQLTTGHVVWRKSTTTDSINGRYWIIAADASTMYMWILTGDNPTIYYFGSFGDIYSLKASDPWKCLITGRVVENSNAAASSDWQDIIANLGTLTTAQPGHYMPRTAFGFGGSIGVIKKGDISVANGLNGANPNGAPFNGVLQTPNLLDNALYFSPIWIIEPSATSIRGKWRGLYQICHTITNFSDGQVIQGSGDFAGKTFLLIKTGANNQGLWTLEISNTVDTN